MAQLSSKNCLVTNKKTSQLLYQYPLTDALSRLGTNLTQRTKWSIEVYFATCKLKVVDYLL